MASIAQAQVDIELVPLTAGPYIAGQRVRVSAEVTQTSGATRQARLIQFDVNATDPELNVLSPTTHDGGTPGNTTDDIRLWDFRAGTGCEPASAEFCGDGYLINSSLTDTITPGLKTAWIAFIESAQDATLQITLPNGVATKVAEFDIDIPAGTPDGTYTFDVVNAAAGPDGGAKVHWGFGMTGDTITTNNASAITGGSLDMVVNGGGGTDCDLVATSFPCDDSLTRTRGHVLRFTFDCGGPDLPSTPAAGDVEVRMINPDGSLGADLSGSFGATIEGGTTLRLAETGTVLANETWYAVLNTGGWSGVSNFEMNYVVVRGDAEGGGFTNFADLSLINANLTGSAADDDPFDIDAGGFVNFADISAAFSFNGSTAPAKPAGHTCTIP